MGFGDGTSFVVENYSLALTPGLGNTLHNYSSAGTYTVKLNVSEMTRSKSAVDTRLVHVYKEGVSVKSIITSPENGIAYGNWIVFNASQSYVINCSSKAISPVDFVAGNLNCTYFHRPGTRTLTGYEIILNWTVYSGGRFAFNRAGSWSNYSNVEFPYYFDVPARHTANVTIDFIRN